MRLINIISAPDTNQFLVVENSGSPATLKITMEGNNTLIDITDKTAIETTTVTLGGVHPKAIKLPPADLILNSTCDCDTNTKALQQASELIKRTKIPVINNPDNIFNTSRDRSFQLLHNIEGVRMPKTVRIVPHQLSDIPVLLTQEGIDYPYIFRSAGDHGGEGMLLVQDENDFNQLERFAFDGRAFYAIEFIDFQSVDTLYRKARIMVIGGRAYVRHLIITDTWKIHAKSRNTLMDTREELRQEEAHFVLNPPKTIHVQCDEIYRKLGLDVFGIDCNIAEDGSMLIFEVNACMNTAYANRKSADVTTYSYLSASSDRIIQAFNALLTDKASMQKG